MSWQKGQSIMRVDLTETRIDHRADKYQNMLRNLQGNILKGHGRNFSVHIFLQFKSDPQRVRNWVRGFEEHYVTSTQRQLKEADEFRTYGVPGRLFSNFFLSAKGYEALGYTREDLTGGFVEKPAVIDGHEVVNIKFVDGMAAAQHELNDPAPETWEAAYQGRQIEAMILLADNDEAFLLRQARRLIDAAQVVATVLTVERGRVMRNHRAESIEHFGYVDGRSQPLFFQTDLEAEAKAGGIHRWDPSAPLDLVLVADPYADPHADCFGSYLVFRKLEQNVRGFKEREEQLARRLGLNGSAAQRAGALIMGRFRDGTPLTSSAFDGLSEGVPNNFTYADDVNGTRCPFSAHIRKVNPRGDMARVHGGPATSDRYPPLQDPETGRRIVRRGISYGARQVEPKDNPRTEQMPTRDVGLLFMCFQSSLANQFGFLQKMWANSPDFVSDNTGIDPVAGQHGKHPCPLEQRWPLKWGKPEMTTFDVRGFVTMKGGEFLFAPSLQFLKSL
jgi:Dyp-type peroxidase family